MTQPEPQSQIVSPRAKHSFARASLWAQTSFSFSSSLSCSISESLDLIGLLYPKRIEHENDDEDEKDKVLYFYPENDTPGCTIQACDLRDSLLRDI